MTNKASETHHVDALVVGAGLVGASAAIGLAKLGLNVLVVEAFELPASGPLETPSFDERSTALSYGSTQILNSLGVWPDLESCCEPIRSIHVSEQGKLGVTRMSAKDHQLPALGYVAPNQAMGALLLRQLRSLSVDVLSGARIQGLQALASGYSAEINQGQDLASLRKVSADLLVIADGVKSGTAALLGIEFSEEEYGQHAVIANVRTELSSQGTAFERFASQGPMALLPLRDERMALVLTRADDEVAEVMEMPGHDFNQLISQTIGERLGRVLESGQRHAYPLRLVRAKEAWRPGLVLLGNARHSLHPVAGQGLNLALRGLACFFEAIAEALAKGLPIGSPQVLQKATASHAIDQHITVTASDYLVKGFSYPGILPGLSREAGLVALNNIPAFKKLFVEQATGLGGSERRVGFL